MILIRSALHSSPEGKHRIHLDADRSTLAKRRWRGQAEDQTEFGFDLESPLADGACFFADETKIYLLRQKPEPVVEVEIAGAHLEDAMRIAWMIGNLHFPAEIQHGWIRIAEDPAVCQLLERQHLRYIKKNAVFKPLAAIAHAH
jgi:urease accessory protein